MKLPLAVVLLLCLAVPVMAQYGQATPRPTRKPVPHDQPPNYPAPTPTPGLDGASVGLGLFLLAIWIVGILLYFLPSFLAWGKDNWLAIFALNFLAGWTFVGWVVALVWALTKDKPPYYPPR